MVRWVQRSKNSIMNDNASRNALDDTLDYAAFVRLVIDSIESAGLEYLIGGAVAAWAWGEPRATQDLDLVVNIPIKKVDQLSQELNARGMLVPSDIILNRIQDKRADIPISAIHMVSGYKADIYPLRGDDPLRKSSLERRALVDLGPEVGKVFLHSPEDLIVYKLWFYSISRQTKHLRDITSIVITLSDELDYEYIEFWSMKKGVNTLWKEMLKRIRSG